MLLEELRNIAREAREKKIAKEMLRYEEVVEICREAAKNGQTQVSVSGSLPGSVRQRLSGDDGLRVCEDRSESQFFGYLLNW